jgi:hypothetical protein
VLNTTWGLGTQIEGFENRVHGRIFGPERESK